MSEPLRVHGWAPHTHGTVEEMARADALVAGRHLEEVIDEIWITDADDSWITHSFAFRVDQWWGLRCDGWLDEACTRPFVISIDADTALLAACEVLAQLRILVPAVPT